MTTLKQEVLKIIDEVLTETNLLKRYKQSFNRMKKIIESLNLDGDVNQYVESCLINTKIAKDRNKYIKKLIHKDFKSLKRTFENYPNIIRKTTFESLIFEHRYSTYEICALMGKFDYMKGMYVIQQGYQTEVLIKANVNDISNTYANYWKEEKKVLHYIPEAPKNDFSLENILSCNANKLLYENINKKPRLNIYTFVRNSTKENYEYCGIYHVTAYNFDNETPYFILEYDPILTPDEEYRQEMDEEKYNHAVSKIDPNEVIVVPDGPKTKESPQYGNDHKRKYHRDHDTAVQAKKLSNFTCEYNREHITFINNTDQRNYVEAHHLIPVSKEDDFENSIDVSANIVTLCPICHRCIHHGKAEDKEIILLKLYNERKERLKKCNIYLDKSTLMKYYKIY